MWRHRATCKHCGQGTNWNEDREASEQEICMHMREAHKIGQPLHPDDYLIDSQRQCDSCLEPYLDDCTKCRGIFAVSMPGTLTACAVAVSEGQNLTIEAQAGRPPRHFT